MLFIEAYRQSLIPFKEAYRMIYKLPNAPKMPLDSSKEAIRQFIEKYQNEGYKIFIISDYGVSLRPDSLLMAMGEKAFFKLRKKVNKYDLRMIEVSDVKDAIEWTYDIGLRP